MAKQTVKPSCTPVKVPAWDVPVRLFHGLLIFALPAAYFSREYADDIGDSLLWWHQNIGLFILSLLVFRILWGIVGTETARFKNFLYAPKAIFAYLTRKPHPLYLGHSPIGGYAVVVLLGVVLAQALAGLMTTDHIIVSGSLVSIVPDAWVERASSYHAFGFWLICGAVFAHLIALTVYRVFLKQRLVPAMVHGKKEAATYQDHARNAPTPWKRALFCAFISFGGVFTFL